MFDGIKNFSEVISVLREMAGVKREVLEVKERVCDVQEIEKLKRKISWLKSLIDSDVRTDSTIKPPT